MSDSVHETYVYSISFPHPQKKRLRISVLFVSFSLKGNSLTTFAFSGFLFEIDHDKNLNEALNWYRNIAGSPTERKAKYLLIFGWTRHRVSYPYRLANQIVLETATVRSADDIHPKCRGFFQLEEVSKISEAIPKTTGHTALLLGELQELKADKHF